MEIILTIVDTRGYPAIIKLCSIVLYPISETLNVFFTSKLKEDMVNPEKVANAKIFP
jgi:hypothetical protein